MASQNPTQEEEFKSLKNIIVEAMAEADSLDNPFFDSSDPEFDALKKEYIDNYKIEIINTGKNNAPQLSIEFNLDEGGENFNEMSMHNETLRSLLINLDIDDYEIGDEGYEKIIINNPKILKNFKIMYAKHYGEIVNASGEKQKQKMDAETASSIDSGNKSDEEAENEMNEDEEVEIDPPSGIRNSDEEDENTVEADSAKAGELRMHGRLTSTLGRTKGFSTSDKNKFDEKKLTEVKSFLNKYLSSYQEFIESKDFNGVNLESTRMSKSNANKIRQKLISTFPQAEGHIFLNPRSKEFTVFIDFDPNNEGLELLNSMHKKISLKGEIDALKFLIDGKMRDYSLFKSAPAEFKDISKRLQNLVKDFEEGRSFSYLEEGYQKLNKDYLQFMNDLQDLSNAQLRTVKSFKDVEVDVVLDKEKSDATPISRIDVENIEPFLQRYLPPGAGRYDIEQDNNGHFSLISRLTTAEAGEWVSKIYRDYPSQDRNILGYSFVSDNNYKVHIKFDGSKEGNNLFDRIDALKTLEDMEARLKFKIDSYGTIRKTLGLIPADLKEVNVEVGKVKVLIKNGSMNDGRGQLDGSRLKTLLLPLEEFLDQMPNANSPKGDNEKNKDIDMDKEPGEEDEALDEEQDKEFDLGDFNAESTYENDTQIKFENPLSQQLHQLKQASQSIQKDKEGMPYEDTHQNKHITHAFKRHESGVTAGKTSEMLEFIKESKACISKLEAINNNLPQEQRINIITYLDKASPTIEMEIPRVDKKIDTLKQEFSGGEVETTLNPGPDDRAIMVMILQNRAYANPTLTMDDCDDPKTALKIFIASKIAGVKLTLGAKDEAGIQADPKLKEKFEEFKGSSKNEALQEAILSGKETLDLSTKPIVSKPPI